ncbi:hypothetical protein L7F22_022714 [Adiantum nelumboides]|nr:hypothetical protein [Adiantum nelumboides]
MDVHTAFLHGDVEEELYMKQPEDYVIPGKEHLVCKLNRSLYGLKQSSRQWYKKFDAFMLKHGYKRSHADHCLYIKCDEDGSPIILVLYVDDMLIAAKKKSTVDAFKEQLKSAFSMKDLGAAEHPYVKISKEDCPNSKEATNDMQSVPYASACGSLMYAMVATRPDIAHAVGVVSRFMANPSRLHWDAMKSIMRYLKGTKNKSLCYGKGPLELKGFCDSDMAGDVDTRKSTSGYVFTLAGGAISWCSRLQKIVALSTTEAEYISATKASKEAIWLARLCSEFGLPDKAPMLGCDHSYRGTGKRTPGTPERRSGHLTLCGTSWNGQAFRPDGQTGTRAGNGRQRPFF